MADVFRIARFNQSTTIDLKSGTLKLKERSWHTRAAIPNMQYASGGFGGPGKFLGYNHIVETFGLVADDTPANVMSAIVELEDVAQQVWLWQNGRHGVTTWWLEWSVDGEDTKRALIHSISLDYPPGIGYSSFIESDALEIRVVIERAPLWETIDYSTLAPAAAISTCGGTFSMGDIPGTELARISVAQFENDGGSSTFAEIWAGIRAPGEAWLADFDPVMECESGTNGTDASDVVDATASNGNKVQVADGGTATLVKRWSQDIATHNSGIGTDTNYLGRYLILLRGKVSAGTWGVQMRSGHSDGVVHEEIYIDSTSWQLYPLGQINIPGWNINEYISGNIISQYTISLYGEQVSGSGNLDLDCVILMPSEHLVYISDATCSDGNEVQVHTLPDDRTLAWQEPTATGIVNSNISTAISNWYMPLDGGMLVVAATGSSAHTIEDAVAPSLTFYPRWRSYRHDTGST